MHNKKTIEILSVVGARPNFMKIASIARAIDERNSKGLGPSIRHLVVHTGQHYDERMSDLFFEELRLPKPDINLGVGSASHAVQTAQVMSSFEPIILSMEPDALIVVGDVNSTIACTLVASKLRYNGRSPRARPTIVHVEAGLRSFDRDMPEEINRVLTDALSDLLFVTEESAISNLQCEGVPRDKIHFVGNVMIDTLMHHLEKAKTLNTPASLGLQSKISGSEYALVTLHRPSNVDSPETLSPLVECLTTIAARMPIVFPLHPRTRVNLERFDLLEKLTRSSGTYLTEPLGYLDFLNLLQSAGLVLTDSGGIQEETTFLQVPCITLRENTERPITVSMGTNYLVGTNPDRILETAFAILDGKGKRGRVPPLWDGKAGQRILEIITSHVETK